MQKLPLRMRIIAWTVLAAILGGAALVAWYAIAEGKILRLALSCIVAGAVAWMACRKATGAKGR